VAADFEAAEVSIAQATGQAVHGMWRTGGGGVTLREASGQGAGTTASKAGFEAAVLWHA